jgi:hypothetical protein
MFEICVLYYRPREQDGMLRIKKELLRALCVGINDESEAKKPEKIPILVKDLGDGFILLKKSNPLNHNEVE